MSGCSQWEGNELFSGNFPAIIILAVVKWKIYNWNWMCDNWKIHYKWCIIYTIYSESYTLYRFHGYRCFLFWSKGKMFFWAHWFFLWCSTSSGHWKNCHSASPISSSYNTSMILSHLAHLVSLLLKLHDLVKVGHASLLLRLPVQLQRPDFELQLLALRLQLQEGHL